MFSVHYDSLFYVFLKVEKIFCHIVYIIYFFLENIKTICIHTHIHTCTYMCLDNIPFYNINVNDNVII